MIQREKPRLWRSLEELRDRARDVEEKVASLVSRAQSEVEEVNAPSSSPSPSPWRDHDSRGVLCLD